MAKYVKNTTWADGAGGGTPITAAKLNIVETGIFDATFGRSTTFPAAPVDGQLHQYPADATNGVQWLFVYNTGSASAHKWELVGGGWLEASVATSQTTASTTYADLTTVGPSVTAPKAGDYLVQFGALMSVSVVGQAWCSPKIGAATAVDADGASVTTELNGASGITVMRTKRLTLAASDVIKLQYRVNTGTGTFIERNVKIQPVRVTP